MTTRKILGKNLLGSILCFLDMAEHQDLADQYPEALSIWRRFTVFETKVDYLIKEYFVNGKRHRQNGPAIEDDNGRYWYQNGKRHRLDGPAVEYNVGIAKYYEYGVEIKNKSRVYDWRVNGYVTYKDGRPL